MKAFEKVIGYEDIKRELMQVVDQIHNKEIYESLGAKMPRGLLLHGEPGLGKTLLANCLIEESGLPVFTLRRTKAGNDFMNDITETFHRAADSAPAIVFLDDMDKFANEDSNHRDAEEYVAVQAAIDGVKETDVFVLATVNKMVKLPASLFRSGRFDKVVEVKAPEEEDARKIIEYYLKDKKISEDVDMDDLSKMISYHSCAELESVLNEAAIQAAFARKPRIAMEDIMEIVLKNQYGMEGNCAQMSEDKIRQTALHEAGHLVASEVFDPGSVGVASIRPNSNCVDGFVRRCRSLPRRPQHVVVSLAGKAAVELYYSEACASGCGADIERAYTLIREGLALSGTQGFGMIDVAMHRFPDTSESMNSRSEAVTQAELERNMFKARDILLKNREFLEKTADALMEKKTLLASDIRRIREDCVITEVAL